MQAHFNDYSIAPVSTPVSEPLRQEITAFWLQHGAIHDVTEARRRADELVCIARNAAGDIVGVNTAYVANLRTADDRYYHYRMFTRPADRHLHLSSALVRAAIATLRARHRTEQDVQGIAMVTENPKLMRPSGRRLLAWLGWEPAGQDRRRLDLWTVEF